jgi:hypothetical protein
MRAYRELKWRVATILAAYLVAAAAAQVWGGRDRELFPIFAWSLFSTVPSEPNEYAVRITAIDGAPLEAKPFLGDLFGRGFSSPRSTSELWAVTQRLGDAISAGGSGEVGAMRRLLEANFLCATGQVDYEVVRLRYRTLDRWATGALGSIEPVAAFGTSEPRP